MTKPASITTICSRILLSHEKNEIKLFAAIWMDIEIIILSEISQTKTNITWYYLHVELKKNDTNGFIYKTNRKT